MIGLSDQLINSAQAVLGQTGSIIGSVAGSAISSIGWLLFILFVSYFLLIESGGLRERIFTYDFRDYNEDARKFSERLGNIWNAFLRGQLILFFLAIFIYTIVLNILGLRFAFGLALIAGLLTPSAGRVVVAGADMASLPSGARDAWRGATLGFVPQRLHLSESLSVAENLALLEKTG